MIDYTLIGKRIQTQRLEKGITQEKLAEQVGISVVYLSKIENGRVYPTLETLSNICTELDTELAAILTNTEVARKDYANDRVVELFNACSLRVKRSGPAGRSLEAVTDEKTPRREIHSQWGVCFDSFFRFMPPGSRRKPRCSQPGCSPLPLPPGQPPQQRRWRRQNRLRLQGWHR